VLAGESLVPELMQDDCTPPKLAAAVQHWFDDPGAAEALGPRFRAIHLDLRRGASAEAARVVDELLSSPHA
jgi:lipid-A-disaccharide synthase